eukprot:s119_g45.t1
MTECSVLEWKPYRHQRVLRSTLAAEAASLDRAEDAANYLGSMLAETLDANYVAAGSGRSPVPIYPVTNAGPFSMQSIASRRPLPKEESRSMWPHFDRTAGT